MARPAEAGPQRPGALDPRRLHLFGGKRKNLRLLFSQPPRRSSNEMTPYGHTELITFAIGADVIEKQWRLVLRKRIALGHLQTDGEIGTLHGLPEHPKCCVAK